MATTAMLPEMTRLFDEWRPGFVLRDPCEFASAMLARRTGTSMSQVAISFADVEAGSIRVASPALEDHQRGLTDALFESPYLTRFPESLDPSPFPSTVRYRAAAQVTEDALPDWWHASDAPLVYVTLGTVLGHMSFALDVFHAVIEAVRSLDARVLLTVGRQFDPARLGPVPAHVHVERWVDQDVVLGSAALVVCHGGSGTVLGALEAAVPLVVVPAFADQFENGRRVARAGVGRVVSSGSSGSTSARRPPSVGDAPMIADAIERVLGDTTARASAARIAAEMRTAPSAFDVLTTLLTRTTFGG
jgi:UDP:flavonoid glycosyltransferase YjiC (YdhE family)